MNDSKLEKIRSAWRETPAFEGAMLDDSAIETVLGKQSRDVSRQFRVSLRLDIGLKAIIAVALAVLLWLLRNHPGLSVLNTVALLVTVLGIGNERAALNSIPGTTIAGGSVRDGLLAMIEYYRERFSPALYFIGLSGPLVFYAGVVHYLWYRYGGLRPVDGVDLAVFIGGLAIAYVLNAGAQHVQFRRYLNEVEDCLREFEGNGDEQMVDPTARLRARRLRRSLGWSMVLLAGVLLLAWLALR